MNDNSPYVPPENFGDLREEGKAGLLYARDEDGNLVAAEKAETGKTYHCPVCQCPVHVTRSKKGKKYYARMPDHHHQNSICMNGLARSFKNETPASLIAKLCHVTPRPVTRGPGTDDPGTDGPGTRGPRGRGTIDTDFKELSFGSLGQIAKAGLDYLNPYDKQGDYYVSDFIITYTFGEKFFPDPNFNLGIRIVYARYWGFDAKSQALIFTMFGRTFSVRFRIIFNKKTDFKKFRDKFGQYVESEGKTVFQKHHDKQEVLIASDSWKKIVYPDCQNSCRSNDSNYCHNCCGTYQTVFTSPKQIFLLDPDD